MSNGLTILDNQDFEGDLDFTTLMKFKDIFYLFEFVSEEVHYEDIGVQYEVYNFVFNRLESVFGQIGAEFNIFKEQYLYHTEDKEEEKKELFVSRLIIYTDRVLERLRLTGELLMSVDELEEYERKCIPLVEELDKYLFSLH